MVFYAYLDPAVIMRAYERQPYGSQCLIAMLRGFMQNCCVIDRNGEVSEALKSLMQKLPRDSDGIMLDKIRKFLERHNRFIVGDAEADVIVNESDQARSDGTIRGRAEVCSLANYQFTNFEHERCMSAHGGLTLSYRQISPDNLFERYFYRALRHARWVTICDGSLGENFKANYRFTVERFLSWLRTTNVFGSECNVSFKCLAPFRKEDRENKTLKRVQWRIDQPRCATLKTFFSEQGVTAAFYRFLPHDRFILTDQFALEIGRGMDFLDHTNNCVRDVSVATKDLNQVQELLKSYNRNELPTV